MSNLVVRSLTGIVFVAVLVGGTLYSPLTFTVLFALITGLSVWEFSTNVNNHAGASVNRLINTVAGVYLFLAFSGYCADFVKPDAFIPYLVSIMYLLISELYLQKRNPLKNWAYAFASQIYVALAFSLLNVLAFQYNPLINRTEFLPIYALSIFIFLWTSDSGALPLRFHAPQVFPCQTFSAHFAQQVMGRQHWRRTFVFGCRHPALAFQSRHLAPSPLVGAGPDGMRIRHLGRPGRKPFQASAGY